MNELFKRMMNDPATARKFITALIGAAAVAVSVGLLPAEYNDYVTVVIAFATSLGVYAVPNEKEVNYDRTTD